MSGAIGVQPAAGPSGANVDLRLLGPLGVVVDGFDLTLGGHKQRALLAVLAVNRNRTLSVSAIIDAVWDDDPPVTATSIVQVYVSALRRILPSSGTGTTLGIRTIAPGYQLAVGEQHCDAARFQQMRRRADNDTEGHRWEQAATGYRQALAEWNGPALADLRGLPFADAYGSAIEEDRLHTVEARVDADLACGRHAAVTAELIGLTHDHPLRERFWEQLIVARYRCGQQADALATYRTLREVFQRELGLDPSPTLQKLEQAILRHDDLAHVGPSPSARTPAPELERTLTDDTSQWRAILLRSDGRRIAVSADGLRIGRTPDNDLVLDDAKTSRQHAIIVATPDGFLLSDLHSRNGTYVDNTRLTTDWNLAHGDHIRIGDTVLTFYLDGPV